jgi:aspartyl-tRNA(Asn)/glutamyl-tRNA(Gln) amidotransferase subunit C
MKSPAPSLSSSLRRLLRAVKRRVNPRSVSLTPERIRSIAELARLTLGEDEVARMAGDIARILEYVAQLDELDTTNVEATSHVVAMSAPLRKDEVTNHPAVDDALANAPERDDGYFVVPAIIE